MQSLTLLPYSAISVHYGDLVQISMESSLREHSLETINEVNRPRGKHEGVMERNIFWYSHLLLPWKHCCILEFPSARKLMSFL